MTTVHPVEFRSPDRTAVSGEGHDVTSVDEMARGKRFVLPSSPSWDSYLGNPGLMENG